MKILGHYSEDSRQVSEKLVEWVDIDTELSAKARWKKETDSGRTLVVDLPRNMHVSHLDVLYDDGERMIVARMMPESVIVMEPSDMEAMGTLSYHIGNLHQPCLVSGALVIAPNEAVLQELAATLGVLWHAEERILPHGFATRSRGRHTHAL